MVSDESENIYMIDKYKNINIKTLQIIIAISKFSRLICCFDEQQQSLTTELWLKIFILMVVHQTIKSFLNIKWFTFTGRCVVARSVLFYGFKAFIFTCRFCALFPRWIQTLLSTSLIGISTCPWTVTPTWPLTIICMVSWK